MFDFFEIPVGDEQDGEKEAAIPDISGFEIPVSNEQADEEFEFDW